MSKIEVASLEKVNGLPLIHHVEGKGIKALDWVERHKGQVGELLATHGALLIRGLRIPGSKPFGVMLETLFDGELLSYMYRSTPRTGFSGNVYTATEYPSDQVIPMHNENAYARSWPARLGFMCLIPASEGGQTPICSSADVYQMLSREVREAFESKGVQYVRNYSDMDLPWQEVFQTEDTVVVEQFCHENNLTFEWLDSGLRTRQSNPAVLKHPVTGENLWFNQAHLFHASALPQDMQDAIRVSMDEEFYPRNSYFGDGTHIPRAYLDEIRQAYAKAKLLFDWQKGDILLLDNMRFCHGREPYKGARKVLTGMAQGRHW